MEDYKGIYGYWDNVNDEVVYVGRDSNMSKGIRKQAHLYPFRYMEQKINQVIQNNPERYEYYEICNLPMSATDEELNHYEKHYIKLYDPKFNFTEGGDGMSGFKHSEKTKDELRKLNKGENNPNYGKSPSEETRRKHSEAIKGENHPNYGKGKIDELGGIDFLKAEKAKDKTLTQIAEEIGLSKSTISGYLKIRNLNWNKI